MEQPKETSTGAAKKRKSKACLWLNRPKKKSKIENAIVTPLQSKDANERPKSIELRKAPLKTRGNRRKIRRKLYNAHADDKINKEITEILPTVISKLRAANVLGDFCNFLKVIHNGKFPLTNIAFLLFLDVVRWYSLDNTSSMEYSEDCLKFWKVMYRLFHGKALRFMTGMKSEYGGNNRRGEYSPENSSINFAVPSHKRVATYESVGVSLPSEMKPGIINEALELKSETKSYVLSFDGKKLAPGLTNEWGDQDLFGHEEKETLSQLRERLQNDLNIIELAKVECQRVPGKTEDKIEQLERAVKVVSVRIKDLRMLFLKQQMALNKFMKEGGKDWKKSKYVYAISSVQAQMFLIRNVVKKLLDSNSSLLLLGSLINGTSQLFSENQSIDIFSQRNMFSLKEVEDIPEGLLNELRFIKQRSPQWFDARKQLKLTGSTIFGGLGLDSLKLQRRHFDKVVKNIEIAEVISEDTAKRMEHGTVSEIHAIATLTTKVLPLYYPNLAYIEEGAHVINSNGTPLILVSPDGSLGKMNMDGIDIPTPVVACEFKCPSPSDFRTPVHYDMPIRYIPQVLSEMASMNVEELIYLCWTDESSTVFRVHFDTDTWKLITEEAQNVYLKETPKCPTRLSAESKVIKERLHIFRENNCEFICEVASCKGERIGCSYLVDGSPYVYPICNTEERNNLTVDEMDSIFSSINTCINEAYQICRKKATEVIVWILADTDRIFNPDVPYAIPIAYAMKGYSLGTKPMREMHEDVLRMCHEKKINVVASCFDGQWAKLSTRDKNDKPLTIMQLQRDVYSEASKLTRDAIVKKLLSESILPAEQIFSITEKTEEGLKVSSPMLKRITLSLRHKLKQKKRSSVVQNLDSDTVSCLPDEALETLIVEDNHTMFPDRIDVEEETTSENTVGDNDDEDNDMNEVADQMKNDKPVPPETVAAIFHSLTIHTKVSVSRKWSKRTVSDLIKILDDTSLVRKMQHDELNVVIQLTKTQQLKLGIKIKQTCCRDEKAIFIRRVFGSKQDEIFEKKVKELMPLKLIASKVVRTCLSKIPKERLNNTVAAMMIDKRYCEWKEASAFKLDTEIYNIGKTIWFSFPEFDEEKQKMEPKCLDAHHLLVNLRCKVCKDGVWGIRKDAWHAVADSDNNIISKGIVVDLLDKQNNAFAKRTFSNEVEEQMRKLDFVSEANFCYMIRRWYEAEDSAGFSAEDRIQRKLQLKAFLLKDVDFGIFPPPGMYVKGFPKIMYEGFLQRIDTSIQLYDIVKSGSYNQRALSSLVNETFFGELSELEPTKLGCPKAISIPRLMANVTEMQHFRCDPSERAFNINTSRRPVYPQHSLLPVTDKTEICVATYTECNHQIPQIYPRNHTFDSPSRLNKKQRKSKRSDVSKPNAVSRGCLPIRQHHKCDESKVLPTTRLGIELQD